MFHCTAKLHHQIVHSICGFSKTCFAGEVEDGSPHEFSSHKCIPSSQNRAPYFFWSCDSQIHSFLTIWKSQFLGIHHGTHIAWIPACSFSACCMSLRFASSTLAFASHPRKLGLSQNTVGYGSSIDKFNGKFNVYFMGPSLMAVILAQVSRFGFQW